LKQKIKIVAITSRFNHCAPMGLSHTLTLDADATLHGLLMSMHTTLGNSGCLSNGSNRKVSFGGKAWKTF
jgi:hypothetical protein